MAKIPSLFYRKVLWQSKKGRIREEKIIGKGVFIIA